jgi:hypothetical protein
MADVPGLDGDEAVNLGKLIELTFEIGAIRPPSADMDTAAAIGNEIESLSRQMGFEDDMGPLGTALQRGLLRGKSAGDLSESELANFYCVVNVFNWLCSGGKTAFLQDADTPIMPAGRLIEVLRYLKETFPSIERITSYCRSKTITKKRPEELRQLHEAGLSRLHVGLETGDAELLKYIDKGITAEGHIVAGRKAMEAGFELSEYVMPGLGGREKWVQHAENTARVLNEINPHFIRMRPFVPRPPTPMYEAYQREEYELTSPHERLQEIALIVEKLEVTSRLCFDHMRNTSFWVGNMLIPLLRQEYDGYKLPEQKKAVLELINKGLEMNEASFLDVRDMVGSPLF